MARHRARTGVWNAQRERRGEIFMTTFLLIVHGLLAVALLGSITHQAISVLVPARKIADSFVGRVRAVSAPSYVSAIIFLYVPPAPRSGLFPCTTRMGTCRTP